MSATESQRSARVLCIRLSYRLIEQLNEAAKRAGLPRNAWVRTAIEERLREGP